MLQTLLLVSFIVLLPSVRMRLSLRVVVVCHCLVEIVHHLRVTCEHSKGWEKKKKRVERENKQKKIVRITSTKRAIKVHVIPTTHHDALPTPWHACDPHENELCGADLHPARASA